MDRPKLCITRLLDQNFGMCISPQDLMSPSYNFHGNTYFRPWKLSTESANGDFGITTDNAKDKFKIIMDMQHFKPNEISVKATDYEVIIEGKHEEREDDYGFVSRQFTRRCPFPRDCKAETVTSTLSADGVLTIMADKLLAKDIKGKEKIVPVKMCGPCPENNKVEAKMTCDMIKNGISDVKKEIGFDKKAEIGLKEDHCRLLKPELLKEAVSGTEKLISESRKEADELLKLISSSAQVNTTVTAGKLEEAIDNCKTAIAELTEKVGETNTTEVSQCSSVKSSMISETIESKETSSSMSKTSMAMSSMKASSDKTSEILISAELREAAEIM